MRFVVSGPPFLPRAVSGQPEQVYGPVATGTSPDVDLPKLLDEMTPYVVSALGAYGKSVLTKEKAASLTVGVGLGLSQRIFGRREEGDDSLPDALAKVVEHPNDPAYVNALRNLMRDKLKDDSAMADDVKRIIAEAKEAKSRATAKGDRTAEVNARKRTITTGSLRRER